MYNMQPAPSTKKQEEQRLCLNAMPPDAPTQCSLTVKQEGCELPKRRMLARGPKLPGPRLSFMEEKAVRGIVSQYVAS